MIRLSTLRDPVSVDLTDVYPDFKVVLRRVTSVDLAEARDATLDALRKAREGMEALAPYGLDQEDAHGVRINPRDPTQMARAGRLVGMVEVAIRALISWEGVVGDDGEAAPINRESLSILLLDQTLERRLQVEIDKASRVLVTEGNA